MNDKLSTSSSQECTQKFSGTFNFPEVHFLVRDGVLTGSEAFLLSVIYSFIDHKSGTGCWASIGTLAKECNRSARQLHRMMRHLIKLGLVIQTGEHQVKTNKMPEYHLKWTMYLLERSEHLLGVTSMSPGDMPVTLKKDQSLSDSSLVDQSKTTDRRDRRNLKTKGNESPYRNSTTSSHKKEKEMSFGLEQTGFRPASKTTDFHMRLAIQHKTASYKAGKLMVPKTSTLNQTFKTKDWARIYAKFMDDYEVSAEEMQKTMDWYCTNISKEFTPTAFCARHFCHKYNQIQEAMKREAIRNPEVVVTEEATKILKYLPDDWPKGSITDLPKAVQLTYQFTKDFIERLRKNESPLANHIWEEILGSRDFTLRWFKDIHREVIGWSGWSGKIMTYVPNPRHARFNKLGEGWAREYYGTEGSKEKWAKLIQDLYGV